jgi:integrase
MLESHPATRMDKPGGKGKARERVLDDDEIRLFWHAILEPPVSKQVGLALRLTLLLGLRASEASEMAKAELEKFADSENAALHLLSERTKNKQPHWLPLLPLARGTIAEALALSRPRSNYVFCSPAAKDAPIAGHALGTAMRRFSESLKERKKEAGVVSWLRQPPTPHDLRRTLRTRLAELEIQDEHADQIMNHKRRDIGNVHYNKYKYAPQKRAALAAWYKMLEKIVASNIIPMPGKKRARA